MMNRMPKTISAGCSITRWSCGQRTVSMTMNRITIDAATQAGVRGEKKQATRMLATSGYVALKPIHAGSPKVSRASWMASRQTMPARKEIANSRIESCRKKIMPATTRGRRASA